MPEDLPALLGGVPAFPDGPPAWPGPDPEVAAALAAAVAAGTWGLYVGPHVEALEAEFCRAWGVGGVRPCASGTLAVEAALRAVRVGPGDEVVVAGYDYPANFLAVAACGALPVLADVGPGDWQLDLGALDAALSPRVRAVLASHLHGGLVPMRALTEWAARRGVAVVEDAAQAAGAVVDGRPAGAWGDAGVLSFGGSKLLTAGRGGAVLATDAGVLQRAKLFLARGPQQWAALSELQAAALAPQLARLPERTRTRAAAVAALADGLAGVPGLTPFGHRAGDAPAYYKVGFCHDAAESGVSREVLCAALRAEGVALDPGFAALAAGRAAHRYRAGGPLAEAARAGAGAVVLHHPVLLGGAAAGARVADAVRKVLAHRDRWASRPTA